VRDDDDVAGDDRAGDRRCQDRHRPNRRCRLPEGNRGPRERLRHPRDRKTLLVRSLDQRAAQNNDYSPSGNKPTRCCGGAGRVHTL
jgi:hypothetical protein